MAVTTYEIKIGCPLWTVNKEVSGRLHWRERNELVGQVRWAAKIRAMELCVPMLNRVEIVAQPQQSRRGPAGDPGAYASPVKAAIDGLRDAKVLLDDTEKYVAHVKHLPSARVEAKDVGLILYLTPVELQA